MSVKPELTLSCLKESKRFQFGKCPIGTFVVRLYWADYSKYVPSSKKLDGVYLLYDNKLNFGRICQFAITSLESIETLISNCAPATGTKENYFRSVTKQALFKFRQFAKVGYQFIRPIKIAVQAAVSQIKQSVSIASETVKDTAKSIFRRFDPRQPQSFAKCTTLEQAKYLFDRVPTAQKNQKLIDNYLAACDRISPQAQPVPTTTEERLTPQYGLTLDDVAPALVEQNSEIIEHIPASDRQVRSMMADGYKANARRCKQWIIGVGKSIPGFQVLVKSSDKRKAEVIMQQVVENILLAELSVLQLSDIIAGI